MNIILFESAYIRQSLLPLTYTRPIAALRVGILTIAEKWRNILNASTSFATEKYLSQKFPLHLVDENYCLSGSILPDSQFVEAITRLKSGQVLKKNGKVIAAFLNKEEAKVFFQDPNARHAEAREYTNDLTSIENLCQIFQYNSQQIRADYALITKGRQSAIIEDQHTIVYGNENIFLEEGVQITAAILNASNGPIYLGKGAVIHEGAIVKGPFALCEGGHVNMGAKIRGDVTIGPYSKVGGEVSNSVIFSNSNKGHDGFLGASVIGEWCNLGADTNTSNLKNNYASVKLWNYNSKNYQDTGLQFCGLIMGDHSKCGINTMFNTGTVVGVSANIFGAGFPRNFVPSFAWGGSAGFSTFARDKALEVAKAVMQRRNQQFDQREADILQHIFASSTEERAWERKNP